VIFLTFWMMVYSSSGHKISSWLFHFSFCYLSFILFFLFFLSCEQKGEDVPVDSDLDNHVWSKTMMRFAKESWKERRRGEVKFERGKVLIAHVGKIEAWVLLRRLLFADWSQRQDDVRKDCRSAPWAIDGIIVERIEKDFLGFFK